MGTSDSIFEQNAKFFWGKGHPLDQCQSDIAYGCNNVLRHCSLTPGQIDKRLEILI